MLEKNCETTEKKSFSVRGSSVIENTTVCTFSTGFDKVNGKLPDNAIISISQTIINSKLYMANKEQCREDYMAFSDYVDTIIDGTSEE